MRTKASKTFSTWFFPVGGEAYLVKTFMGMIDQRETTLVFCATQEHAGIVRDLINQAAISTTLTISFG